MDWSHAIPAFLIGIFSGFLTVTAGAAVTVVFPVLIAIGLSADSANATSRVSLAIGGSVAALVLIIKNQVDWKAARPLLLAAGAGALCGALFGAKISSPHMLTLVTLTSLVSMVLVFLRPARWLAEKPGHPVVSPRHAALLFFGLCIYEGVVAVDSALLRLIALVYLLGYPLASANPIKLIAGLVMFAVSSVIYAKAGQIDWPVAAWLSAGSVIGACIAVPFACSIKAQSAIYRLLQVTVTIETLWLAWHWWQTNFAANR